MARAGLYRAVTAANPDVRLIERLLRSWCRVTVVKNKKVVDLKAVAQQNLHHINILRLLEKYENTNEMAMAFLASGAMLVRQWIKQGECNRIYLSDQINM